MQQSPPVPPLESLLNSLIKDYPSIQFVEHDIAYWSPENSIVYYTHNDTHGAATLLHELGHAILGHQQYSNDFELLAMEVAAWRTARDINHQYHIPIDETHVQDCLDSYRDWLHHRSTCSTCGTKSLQTGHTGTIYRCHNCHAAWQVSTSRFCRPYRQMQNIGTEL